MQTIKAIPGERICIGYEGEHLARQVCFDLSEWFNTYGAGSAELIYRRPGDENAYPVATECEEKMVLWTVTATDTARAGLFGEAELRYYVGETLVKSAASYVTVLDAMGVPAEPPDEPAEAWLDEVLASGVVAKEHRNAAESAAGNASTSAETSGEAAATAELAKEQAAESEMAAAQSEKNAKASEEAALKAAQAAENTVNNAAWVAAEVDENGHLIVTQSDNFNGAVFTINYNGHLEVAYT